MAPPAAERPHGVLVRRVASAAVLIPVAVGADLMGGWVFAFLVLGAALGLAWEWSAVTGTRPRPMMGATVAVWLAAVFLGPQGGLAAICAAAAVVYRFGRGWASFGVVYIGAALVALLDLRARPDDGWLVLLGLFCVVWATDTGAYVVGRAIGGPRLAPRWSPGKTWAGAAGGLAGGALVALIAWAAGIAVDARIVIGLALALSLAGQAGDMLESIVKRRFHRKDSGRLIPGHGGLMDRLDSLLVAAPLLALAMAWGGEEPWLLRAPA